MIRLVSVVLLFAAAMQSWIVQADYSYEYYHGDWSTLPDFDSLTPVATGTVDDFDISIRQRDSQYGFRYAGVIDVATADTYTFYTNSDDGSQLFIDGALVVDNDGLHAPIQRNGQISLLPGSYNITVTFFEQGGGEVLDVTWSNSTNGQQPIPADGIIGVVPDSSLLGQWGPVILWPHVAVSAANLPDGRVLTWSGSERDTWPTTEQTYSGTWNPATGEFSEIFHGGHNMFCAHLAMTEDGRVFVNGGRNQTNSPWTSLFDYRDNSWQQIENMPSGGRWYPTTLALTDGDMFTAIGTATNQRNPERWDVNSGWQVQNGIDFDDMVLDDYFSSGTHGESSWWPLLHVAPNGKIFHSGPTPQMHWINPTGAGSFESVGSPFTDWYHKHGITIMYDEGRLLTAGGWIGGNDIASSNQAFIVDLNGPTPVIAATQSMGHARKFHNGVMLPSGEVLVIGGNTSGQKFSDNGAVLTPEIWDPVSGTWREGAPMAIPRNYHSIALLLADGRVLAAGSGYSANSVPASTHQDGQVYSPPYLFQADGSAAPRPVISAAPGIVETGTTFNLTTSEAVAYFSLIKMSSTTHGINTDVRYLRPQFVNAGGNSYDITLHQNPNVATPGYWMLFAVNSAGTPSEAHVIRVTAVDTRLQNRALNGVVSQSSTAVGGDFDATNAIDGDHSGDAGADSLASTNMQQNAWWEIDLGQVFDIDTLRLWNRTDCCAERLADFYLLASADPFDSQDLTATLAQPGVTSIFNSGSAGRQFELSPGVAGRYLRVQLTGAEALHLAEVQIFGDPAPLPPAQLVVENGTLDDVGSDWQSVSLTQMFNDPVVIASVNYDGTQLPAVSRIRNPSSSQFEVRVQNPGDAALAGYRINYLVVEAGVYDNNGLRLEAVKFLSTVTDHDASWNGELRAYQQTYSNPVVVGQVMSSNDPDWSVFWASDGNVGNPPSASTLAVGKHVAEDTDIGRSPETIGYLVFESGSGSIGDMFFQAGVGSDTVEGVNGNAPYLYPLSGDYELAVISSAAMDGVNGGWPVLYGPTPVSNQLGLGIDEDQINDSERAHTTEQAAYVAMTSSTPGLIVNTPLTLAEVSGTEVTYVADATGPGTLLYSWNSGSGDTPFSTNTGFAVVFSEPGRHLVTLTVRDGNGNEVQTAFYQLIHAPLTATLPKVSGGILELAGSNEIWSVNPDNDSLSIVDAADGQQVAEVALDDEPRAIAQAPDGRVWITNKGSASISIIDPLTRLIEDVLVLDAGSQPHGIVIGPAIAYVALEATGEVIGFNAFSASELLRAPVGSRARHLSLDAAAALLYVSLFVTPPLPGESGENPVVDDGLNHYGGQVVQVDAATLNPVTTIVLRHSDRLVSEHSGPGVPNYLGPAVISPDGSTAWVPSKQDNILAGALRGGQGMTFDQTVRAITSKIELPSATENFALRVDHDNASVASHAAFGPYGLHLFTALEGNREVAVVDVNSGTEIFRFDVGRAPQNLLVSGDGNRLYVHNFMDRSLGIYDISDLIHSGQVAVSAVTTVSTVASEALTPEVLLGKQLFYDARDDRLAALDYMSCASCHNDGDQDGRVWDFTGVGEGLRNTISLEGRAGLGHGDLHWSANFDEVQDFEAQIRNFAGGIGLMDDADFFSGSRSDPLGDAKTGFSVELDALASYVASLDRIPTSPHRNLNGDLSSAAAAGALVFLSAGCDSCHSPLSLTDSSDGNGLHDIGTLTAASGNRLGGALAGLDTPSLLGAWHTPPYLHDGSRADLQAAIAAHQSVFLTTTELDQLAALIRELDSGDELLGDSGPSLAGGVVTSVGSGWQTVNLGNSYDDLVVVAAVAYDETALPAVPRIRNADGSSFEIRVQNPNDTVLSGYRVHYLVAEAGVYTAADHGIHMEAVIINSTLTDNRQSWTGTAQSYQQSYLDPVVVGQVMSANDSAWSVFWASNGSRQSPPTASSIFVGKHVAEDSSQARLDETIGYIVIDAGSGSLNGQNFVAGNTADNIAGLVQSAPYLTQLGASYTLGVVSSVGMDGNNGGWPVLYGAAPLAGGQLRLGIDEDQIRDSERNHTTEQASYFLLQ